MNTAGNTIFSILDFLRRAEGLKSTLRSSWTRSGRQESTAEHSWRLSLFALLVSQHYPELDALRLLQLCIVHDLGETINGDIPAPEQDGSKAVQEREDMRDLLRPLPRDMQGEFMALWEEYERAETPEARVVKALDKLETLLQQTQGINPSGFDYAFNLGYGVKYTGIDGIIRDLRAAIDEETACCLHARQKG
ncbi:HD domain-containing protein [Salidesulfovibrio onnuriiensis]|uniref:HD domain-containing protein n=1 Tax=Salidesulfovibrio onnuriiensis TaxID=2583823 RepID=UPI0011CB0ADC|nr:HD domain-containing protein [Salidesulfovibrio onnuriiensis]